MTDCLFCKIVAGELPAEIVYRGDDVLAFRDITPQAPAHLLIIPHAHVSGLPETGPEFADVLGRLLVAAGAVARSERLESSGYRVVINSGPDGGQTVPHLHLHVLGGRRLGWPPG